MGADGAFQAAATRVVEHLQDVLPLEAWVVARVEGEDWVPVALGGPAPALRPSVHHRWADTLCSRLAQGAPPVAERVEDVPAYARAPLARRLGVRAYVGQPVCVDGRTVGSLCGLAPQPQPGRLTPVVPEVTLLADLLSRLAQVQQDAAEQAARARLAEELAHLDPLTAVLSRRGWQDRLATEVARCDRAGEGMGVVCLDVDDLKAHNDTYGHEAGDALLRSVARTLSAVLRPADLLARLGGDEFAVASPGLPEPELPALVARLRSALVRAGLAVSLGAAWRAPGAPVPSVMRWADARMYDDKRLRHAG